MGQKRRRSHVCHDSEKTGYLDVIGPQIGIESSAYEYVLTKGITPSKDFMLGGGQTYTFSDPFESSLSVALNDRAQVKAVSSNGRTPLIWSTFVNSGSAVVCNIGIYGKVLRGFLRFGVQPARFCHGLSGDQQRGVLLG